MNEFEKIKSEINIGKSIESMFILKNIFSFLSDQQKLNLIKNNKHLQNKLDITIKDYKIISWKYKVGERNGKGKEYYNDGKLGFEGEYINGKRNGKGKEYHYDGKIEFEGE